MKKSYKLTECKYHRGIVRSRSKCDCICCQQSIKQMRYSEELMFNHQYGKKCRDSNNCPTCCEIRWLARLVNHFAYDGANCSKKCEACNGQLNTSQFSMWTRLSENLPKILYFKMLPRRRKAWKYR